MGHVSWIGKQNIKILIEKQVSHLVLAGLHSVFVNGIFGGMVLPQLSGLPILHPSCENFELPTQHTSQENTKQRQSQRDRNLPYLHRNKSHPQFKYLIHPLTTPPLPSSRPHLFQIWRFTRLPYLSHLSRIVPQTPCVLIVSLQLLPVIPAEPCIRSLMQADDTRCCPFEGPMK